mgnify:CR=1 FL=1
MKNLSISSIVLWILAGVSIVLTILFFAGEQVEELTTTGGVQTTWAQTDMYLWWIFAIIFLGVGLLLIFAVKTFITMLQQDAKGAVMSLVSILVFVAVIAGCYFASSAEGFSRVVNGETQTFTTTEMNVIDMWIYCISLEVIATVALIVIGGVKNLIKK